MRARACVRVICWWCGDKSFLACKISLVHSKCLALKRRGEELWGGEGKRLRERREIVCMKEKEGLDRGKTMKKRDEVRERGLKL